MYFLKRLLTWWNSQTIGTQVFTARKGTKVGEDDQGNVYYPVSYTHLRAHETVLDLVCRLLLEKKKQEDLHTTFSRTL